MATAAKEIPKLRPGFRVEIEGRVDTVTKYQVDASKPPIFTTLIRVPAPDEYDDTLKISIRSGYTIGQVGEIVKVSCGMRTRSWKSNDGTYNYDPVFWIYDQGL